MKKYTQLKHKGIRKNNITGRYEAYKQIKKKRYSHTFNSIPEAQNWLRTFVPDLTLGKSSTLTMKDLIEDYKLKKVPQLGLSTQGVVLDRLKIFDSICTWQVEDITPNELGRFFHDKMSEAIRRKSNRRNFDQEIKDLKSLFKWYRLKFNYKFQSPVPEDLKKNCVLKKGKKAKHKMNADEFNRFLKELPPYYQDIAIVQSRLTGRIGEIAGLQFRSIDFKNKIVMVEYTTQWGRRKEFLGLKEIPKNEELKECFMTPDLEEILKRRLSQKHSSSDFVFHENGEPIGYRKIQHQYDKALKKAGLYGKFSGTHILRHFMASLARSVCGSIDAVQAITGHRSVRVAEHYSGRSIDLQSRTILQLESHLNQTRGEMNQYVPVRAEERSLASVNV